MTPRRISLLVLPFRIVLTAAGCAADDPEGGSGWQGGKADGFGDQADACRMLR